MAGSSQKWQEGITVALTVDLLSILIDHGADVNVSGRNGELPIHWAARSNSTGAIAWLIDNGVGLNEADENGYTALHHAAQNVSVDAIDLLAQRGADLDIAAGGGNFTPLGWAISLGLHDAVEALVQAGADVGVFFSKNIWGADVALSRHSPSGIPTDVTIAWIRPLDKHFPS